MHSWHLSQKGIEAVGQTLHPQSLMCWAAEGACGRPGRDREMKVSKGGAEHEK